MSRARVVHIITRLEPGGSSRNTVDSCAAQAEDFDVTLIAGPHPASAAVRNLLPRAVRYIELPQLQREISAGRDRKALLELKRLLTELRPDIVHTHTSKAGALGRLAAGWANLGAEKPAVVVHTPHGHLLYGYYGPFKTFVFKLAERFLARFTGRFVALTPGEKRESCAAGIGRPDQWQVIHSGVELPPRARADRAALGIAPQELAVGTVARLEPVKGVRYFIEAAALLAAELPEAGLRFAVIGGGAQEEGLKALAARLGVAGKVVFTGFRDDAAALAGALDIYVQPSLNEAMGRAPLEAQALGVPAVVTSVCGLPDVVRNGETGLLAAPASARSLADAIGRLARSPELRLRMGAAARDWALSRGPDGLPRFGAESMNRQLKNFYNTVLAARGD